MAKRPVPVTGRSSRLTPVRSPGTSTAEVVAEKRFSNQLFAIGQTGQGMLDEIEVEEASLEGTIAGRDINGFKPRRDKTLTARAFNRAGLRSFQSEISIQANKEAANLFEQHRNDPAKLKDALNGYRTGIQGQLEQQFPEAVQDFVASYERQSAAYMRQASDDHLRVQESQAAGKSAEFLDSLQEGAENIAFTTVSDVDATAQVAAERRRLVQELSDFGPKQAFEIEGKQVEEDIDRMVVYSPEVAAKALAVFDAQMIEKRVLGKFERAANKESFLNKFNEKLGKADRVQGLTIDQTNTMAAKMRARVRADKTEKAAAVTLLKGDVKDAVKILESGNQPSNLAKLQLDVAGTKLEPILDRSIRLADYAVDLGEANLAALDGELERFDQDPPTTIEGLDRFNLLEKTKTDMEKALKDDPIVWADTRGGMDIPPIDFSDGKGLPEQLANRTRLVNQINIKHGINAGAFTDTESDQAMQAWSQGDGTTRLGMAQMLAESLPAKTLEKTLEGFDKKLAPSFAWMGETLATAGPGNRNARAATLRARGMDHVAADKEIIPTGTDNDLESALRSEVGNIYGASVTHKRVVLDAALDIYAGLAAEDGDVSGLLSIERTSKALELATGGIIDYTLADAPNFAGFDVPGFDADPARTVAPAPGVSGEQMGAWIDGIDVSDVKRWGGVQGIKPTTVVQMIRTGQWRLVSVGGGQYAVEAQVTGSDPFIDKFRPIMQRDNTEEPFVLDWNNKGDEFNPLEGIGDDISLLPSTEGAG